jgi:hypothetical protein
MRGPGNYWKETTVMLTRGLRERWKETTVTLTGAQRTLERDYSDADGGSENAGKRLQ